MDNKKLFSLKRKSKEFKVKLTRGEPAEKWGNQSLKISVIPGCQIKYFLFMCKRVVYIERFYLKKYGLNNF